MSPAQRRKRRSKSKSKKFLLILFFATFLFVLVTHQTKFWRSDAKSFLLIRRSGGDIAVSIFDPKLEKVTNIIIPKNTEVTVARQLGTWKLGSVWKLGENEGLEGRLLAETIVKHFKLPVVVWADSGAEGFAGGELMGIIKAVFVPYKTNLGIGDRVKIGFFSVRIKNLKREEIDLSETNILKQVTLIDGEEGYILTGGLPNWLNALFSNPKISSAGTKVIIVDATGKTQIAEEVGEVIEVMGAKLASIKRRKAEGFDCEILGKEKEVVDEMSKLFSCRKPKNLPQGNFDLEIRIGEDFARRF
ncbi:MAG: hypothetical protein WBD86_00425 [Microgenomates group bacterium]